MAYIIGLILLIITIIIIGLILRKRVYDQVDKLENWKLDITNRNVAAELTRIKNLNLSGETLEKFESWKERWETILTKRLPDIEELLFDAEEAADRYRFPSAKKVIHKINQSLNEIEIEIEDILDELEELLESEKMSHEEMEELQPNIKLLRRKLSQSRYLYGKADLRFDKEIDELERLLTDCFELAESGDYIEARRLVEELKIKFSDLEQEIGEFPELYKACRDELPDQLNDLYNGLKEMKKDGYRVEHLGFEKDIQNYQQRLVDSVALLEKGSSSDVKTMIPEMEERITEMYQLLEKEAVAKNYIEAKIPSYQEVLGELGDTFSDTKQEVEQLRQAYYFEDGDMEKYLVLEKSLTRLKNRLNDLKEDMEDENVSHVEIRDQLENGFKELEELEEKHEEFKKFIYNLRKDELVAKEKLSEIREQINHVRRKLEKSNVPGIPIFIWNMMEEATEKNNNVISALESQPLDIAKVQTALTEAKQEVDNLVEQTNLILEQAYLTEQVIQYANRYRSKHPLLAAKLSESERLFRSFEYELSLEKAAAAVEEIDPGSLKRIEANQENFDI